MKNKLTTLLLAIFMVIPIVGCGDPNLDTNPGANEAKILLEFAEREEVETDVFEYTFNANDLSSSYSDCAELQGAGFYNVGSLATIGIRYNATGCSFKGWVKRDGENVIPLHESDSPYNYAVQNKDAGQTLTFYAIMGGPNDTSQSLNVKDMQIEVKEISVTKYVPDNVLSFTTTTFNLSGENTVELPNGKTYKLEEDKFVDQSDSSEYPIEDEKVTIGNAVYTVVMEEVDPAPDPGEPEEYVKALSIKVLTIDASNKYFLNGDKIYKVSNDEECPIDKNDNVYLNAVYTVIKDDYGTITGVAEGAVQNNIKTEKITDTALVNYRFPTTDGSVKTFKTINDLLKSKKYPQKSKLRAIDETVNLSYYTISSQFQYYKIIWTYALGKCSVANPTTVFDPMTEEFPASANVCVRANIDMTEGITETFVQEAVTSTFYNQAYIDSDKESACMTTLKADKNITSTCMYIKNIGALTDITVNDATKLTNTSTYYYALAEDSLGNPRMEGIEQSTAGLNYGTYTYNVLDSNFYSTSYLHKETSYMQSFHLKVEPVYMALANALESPEDYARNLTFRYSKYTNSAVVESVLVEGTRYYFNYVASALDHVDYFPTPESGDPPHVFLGKEAIETDIYKIELLGTNPAVADSEAFGKVIQLLSKNPQNFMHNDITKLEENLYSLMFTLVNSVEEFKVLKKYEMTIAIDTATKGINIIAVDRTIDMSAFEFYALAYDSIANLYQVHYYYPEVLPAADVAVDDIVEIPQGFDANKYSGKIKSILQHANIVTSADAVENSAEWVKIISNDSDGYIDYLFYESLADSALTFRLRYYYEEDEMRFESINIHTDLLIDESFNFISINEDNETSLGTAIVVSDGTYTLTTVSNYVITKNQVETVNTYVVNMPKIGGGNEKYIIDMKDLQVYNTVDGSKYELHLNLADELKYYFEKDETYYGVYYETPAGGDPKFVVYEIEIIDAITHIKGAKVGEMTKEGYVSLDSGYYLLTKNEDTGVYTLKISDEHSESFKFVGEEYAWEITIEEIIVKKEGKVVDDDTLDIFGIYDIVKDGVAIEIEAPGDRYITVEEGPDETIILLEYVADTQSSNFFIIYHDVTYTITFE